MKLFMNKLSDRNEIIRIFEQRHVRIIQVLFLILVLDAVAILFLHEYGVFQIVNLVVMTCVIMNAVVCIYKFQKDKRRGN